MSFQEKHQSIRVGLTTKWLPLQIYWESNRSQFPLWDGLCEFNWHIAGSPDLIESKGWTASQLTAYIHEHVVRTQNSSYTGWSVKSVSNLLSLSQWPCWAWWQPWSFAPKSWARSGHRCSWGGPVDSKHTHLHWSFTWQTSSESANFPVGNVSLHT